MPGLTEKIRLFLKKPQNTVEIIVDFLCLTASYVLLFLLPQKVNILFWAVFALAAFLFCIGFFRMGFLLDSIKSKKINRCIGQFARAVRHHSEQRWYYCDLENTGQ